MPTGRFLAQKLAPSFLYHQEGIKERPFSHATHVYFLGVYHVPDTALDTRDTVVKKNSCSPLGYYSPGKWGGEGDMYTNR
jgi:hypothetical protein